MQIKQDVIAAIGNTPLIRAPCFGSHRLRFWQGGISQPGQSVKTAPRRVSFVRFGAALAPRWHHRGRHRRQYRYARDRPRAGFKTVIPDTQSQEKKDALRLLGQNDRVPRALPQQLREAAGRLAEQLARRKKDLPTSSTMSPTVWPISAWSGFGTKLAAVDGFTCSSSGATWVAIALKRATRIRIAAADPSGDL